MPGTIEQRKHVNTEIDLGFKAKGLQWKGKPAITNRQLEAERLHKAKIRRTNANGNRT